MQGGDAPRADARVRMRRAATRSPVLVRTAAEITVVAIAVVARAVAAAVAVATQGRWRSRRKPWRQSWWICARCAFSGGRSGGGSAVAVSRAAVNPAVGMAAASPA